VTLTAVRRVLLLSIILLVVITGHATSTSTGGRARVQNSIVFVVARISGHSANFLMDTGADRSFINYGFTSRVGLALGSSQVIAGSIPLKKVRSRAQST